MKKKQVLLCCALLSFCLTACGGEDKESATNTVATDQAVVQDSVQDDASASEENVEVTETEGEESSEVENTEETALPDREALSEMFTAFNNWSGLQYVDSPISVDTLTAKQAIPIAAHVVGFFNNDLEQNEEGQAVIPQELLDATMEDYFGKTFAVSEVGELETSMVTCDENGNVFLALGDWGLVAPRFEIKDLSLADDESGDVIALVEYGWTDYELGEETLTGYRINYRLSKKEGTKYGFVIADMQAEQVDGNEN